MTDWLRFEFLFIFFFLTFIVGYFFFLAFFDFVLFFFCYFNLVQSLFLLFFVGFWIHQIVSLENVVNQLLICECSVQNHKGIFHDLVVFLLVSFCLLFFYIVFLLFTLLSVSKVYLFILKAAWYAGSLAQLVTTFLYV